MKYTKHILMLALLSTSAFSQQNSFFSTNNFFQNNTDSKGSLFGESADDFIGISLAGNLVGGDTSTDNASDLALHEHDPNRDFVLQALEVGFNLRATDDIQALVNLNTFQNEEGEYEAELEEAFAKFTSLPYGFEVRTGRYLNRFGLQNNIHLHGWDFVDANLTTPIFLGEDGLITDGAELTWLQDFERGNFSISSSFGTAREHAEEEEEGEEAHGGEGVFTQDLITNRAQLAYNFTDFFQNRLGLNYGFGDNDFGRDTQLASIDYSFGWRENGLESGGDSAILSFEYFTRNVEFATDEGVTGDTDQNAFMVTAQYNFLNNFSAIVRYENLEGALGGFDADEDEFAFASDEIERYSAALTYSYNIFDDFLMFARAQYNHFEFEDSDEDSVWFQLGFVYGQPEIR